MVLESEFGERLLELGDVEALRSIAHLQLVDNLLRRALTSLASLEMFPNYYFFYYFIVVRADSIGI